MWNNLQGVFYMKKPRYICIKWFVFSVLLFALNKSGEKEYAYFGMYFIIYI